MSVFLTTRRTSESSILVRVAPPGAESKYCLTSRAEKPLVPPKYSMSRSSSSLECGMFSPPCRAALRNVLTAPCSMARESNSLRLARLPRFTFALQMRQRVSQRPSFRRFQLSLDSGKEPPQSMQTWSLIGGHQYTKRQAAGGCPLPTSGQIVTRSRACIRSLRWCAPESVPTSWRWFRWRSPAAS